LLSLGLISVALALALGLLLGRFMTRQVAGVVRLANAVGRGEALPDATPRIRELGTMADTLVRANATIQSRERASSRLAAIIEQSGEAHMSLSLDGIIQTWNNGAELLLGFSAAEMIGTRAANLIPPEIAEERRDIILKTRRGEAIAGVETERVHKDGRRIPVIFFAAPLRDPSGAIERVTVSYADITGLKKRESQIRLLMHEVNHRSKNLLAVVQSMVWQTISKSDPQSFASDLSERVAGLAANHDLLVASEWQGVAIADLVASQLSHFNQLTGVRIKLAGPPFVLKAAAAQAIGMALHELATNAAKYGSLSTSEGVVEISWRLDGETGPDARFHMRWSEQGGPEVTQPLRKGFGQIVIKRMVEHALEASVLLQYRPTGLLWELDAPLASAEEPQQH
jgi:PAS domain S-box-containing protein